MNFRYTTSKRIIARLYSDFNLQFEARLADALEWIGEAMEYIGVTAQYVEKLYIVDINNHRGVLPCDLVVIRQVVNGQIPMSSYKHST